MFAATKAAFCRADPAFDPLTLFAASEQGVWFDPNDLATVWQDSARTTPGAVGSVVGCIDDKSGHGFNAVQATTAKKPILRLNGTTGYHYLQFDGVDDCLVTPSIDFSAADEMSQFAAVRKLANTAAIICEFSPNVNGSTYAFYMLAGPDAGGTYSAGSKGTILRSAIWAPATNSPHSAVLAFTSDISAPSVTLRLNGVAGTGSTASQGTAGNYSTRQLFVGQRNAASAPLNGHLYGLLVRGKVSSGTEIAAMETCLNTRIGAY